MRPFYIGCSILKLWFHYLLACVLERQNMCITTIISSGGFGTLLRLKCYARKKKKKVDSNKWRALNFPFYCVFIHFLNSHAVF